MTVEEIKNNIGKIVWHIGLGKAKIKEWHEKSNSVLIVNPENEKEGYYEALLHRLEELD